LTTEQVPKIVRNWFLNADEDLRGAIALHDLDSSKYMRFVPYHCQQAAEKSIKGYLAYSKVKFEKTHDIGQLASLILPLRPELESQLREAAKLTIYAIQFRYPDAGDEPTADDSKFAIRVAKGVFEAMRSLIPFDRSLPF